MSNLLVSALFTQNGGDPAVGLALGDIDITLIRRTIVGGALVTLWAAVNPTEEIGGGLYSRMYAGSDSQTYDYFAWAQYIGVAVLDSNYSLQAGAGGASVQDILEMVVEGAITLQGAQRLQIARVAGRATGGGTPNIAFRDQANTKDRITMTVDANGNRSATGVDTT